MRIALVAPPFISVPPHRYGGTELFIAQLALGLHRRGHEVIVYANGESRMPCQVRWLYPHGDWPITSDPGSSLKDLNHTAWAIHDARGRVDLLHLNNAPGLALTRFVSTPIVYTLHHDNQPALTDFYRQHPDVTYVTISRFQRTHESTPRTTTIHHGLDLDLYRLVEHKQPYLAFLGRMAPAKAPHLAIEAARKAGMPIKLAGEIQPLFRDYWETQVKPLVDGRFAEYVGEADLSAKQELLGHATALLFPIQWDEPFGLVMIEAMACGTPVLALAGGSVAEIVEDGVSGWVCRDTDDMARRAGGPAIPAARCRNHVARYFSLDRMVEGYERLYRSILDQQGIGKVPPRAAARRRADRSGAGLGRYALSS
jgi:glycosyltransferase involved in cell wall biosynthesis